MRSIEHSFEVAAEEHAMSTMTLNPMTLNPMTLSHPMTPNHPMTLKHLIGEPVTRPASRPVPSRPVSSRPATARPAGRRATSRTATAVVPAAGPAALRLTRRGRLVVLLLVVVGLMVVFSMGRVSSEASGGPVPASSLQSVTVQPGETLWQIATRVAPQADPRATVSAIANLNHLHNADLVVGQRLLLPR